MSLLGRLKKVEEIEGIMGKTIKDVFKERFNGYIAILFTDGTIICLEGFQSYEMDKIHISYNNMAFGMGDYSEWMLEDVLSEDLEDDSEIICRLVKNNFLNSEDLKDRIVELKKEEEERHILRQTEDYKEYLRLKEKFKDL